jgi:pentapeptide repeat protein
MGAADGEDKTAKIEAALRALHIKIPDRLRSTLSVFYNFGLFGATSALFVFVLQYSDNVDDRHERSWRVLREAISWRQAHPDSGGNVGQHGAIESLTAHCDKWYRNFLGYFFRDCVDLNSIALTGMDLRDLTIPSATLRDGDFSCSNFGRANFRNAILTTAWFKAVDFTEADFSGAKLEDACFYNANVKRAKFNDMPDIPLVISRLKNACFVQDQETDKKGLLISDSKDIQDLASKLPWCSSLWRCEQSRNRQGCPDSILEKD